MTTRYQRALSFRMLKVLKLSASDAVYGNEENDLRGIF